MSPFEFRDAVRRDLPLLILLAGGTGSGKTESALRLATGIAAGGKIAGIDTEHGRMLHKADDYRFGHTEFDEPYTPERYAEAIRDADATGAAVIILDSGSHEYEGAGGVLEIQAAEFERLGKRDQAKMVSWIEPKRRHKAYVRELLRTRAHVILCHRAEDKVEVVKDAQGKTVVQPRQSLTGFEGVIPICERRLPFEATISLVLTADAPGVPHPVKLERRHEALVPLDEQLSEETGRRLGAWAAGTGSDPGTGSEAGPPANLPPAGTASREAQGPTPATDEEVDAVLDLARRVGRVEYEVAVEAVATHREKYEGVVDTAWLEKVEAALREKLPPDDEQSSFQIPESAR